MFVRRLMMRNCIAPAHVRCAFDLLAWSTQAKAARPFLLAVAGVLLMGDGRTCVVLLWETRAMSERNALP
jgi:hypothetical protein